MSLVNNELTKHEKKTYTILVTLISIPILAGLISLVIFIFLAID
jgi:phosphate/sulfate permease